MGNNNSSSKYISLHATSTSLTAGSILPGSILVSIPPDNPTSSVTNQNLLAGSTLIFIGKEDTKVEYTVTTKDSNGKTKRRRRHAYSKNDVIRAVIPLSTGATSVHAGGSYEIPFKYKLPDDLPSSFHHSSHGGHCSVRYKLKLEFRGGSKELPLEIMSKPYVGPPSPSLVQPVTSPVYFCCCVHKGSITVGANVSNTRMGPGQQVVVDLGAKNESSSRIDTITAGIHQQLYWRAGGHSSRWDYEISTIQFRLTEEMQARNKESMREIQEQQKRSGNRTGPSDHSVYREILDAVRDGANQVNLVIPSDAMTSYNGSLMRINHELVIRAKTPSCVSDPEIVVPFQVVSSSVTPPSSIPTANAYPEGWNSNNVTTIPVVQATYVGAVSYGGNEQSEEEEYLLNPETEPVPSAPPMLTPTEFTVKSLLEELNQCLSVKFKLEELLTHPNWKSVIASIQPTEFNQILQKVTLDFDKLDVAQLLIPHIHSFTCYYAVAILRSVDNFLRIQFVQMMLPHVIDLGTNRELLLEELSEWEKVCTERDFENALTRRE